MPERSWKLAQRGSERNRLPLSPVPFIPLTSHFLLDVSCFFVQMHFIFYDISIDSCQTQAPTVYNG